MRSLQVNILLIFSLVTLVFSIQTQAADSSLQITYISNNPNIEQRNDKGGFSELATFLKSTRESNPGTLFLHGGDSLGPSLLSSFDRGSHMIDILNALETSAMAVAQREFSYYEDELTLRTTEADFPILSANIFDPLSNGNLEGVISGYIFEIDGHSIGVTAVVSDEVISNYLPKRISIIDADQAVRKATAELRSQGAELVVLMMDYESSYAKSWLNEAIVDLIFANSNKEVVEDKFKTINSRMLVTKGRNDGMAIDIQVTISNDDGKLSTVYKGKSVDLSKFKPDIQLQQQITQHLRVLSALLDKELGVFGSQVNTLRHFVRTQESQFGNLVADALKLAFNVDVSIFNGGNIRGNRIHTKGEIITRKTLQQELPFRNTAAVLKVNGEQIWQALENGFSKIEDVKGRFPQVSGIKVKISPTAPVGKRVLSVTINNKPLDKTANYRLATTTFLAEGGDGYDSLKSAQRLHETVGEQIISDIISQYVLDKKIVSPKIEGRILQVSNQLNQISKQ